MILATRHTGLVVRDLDKAVVFYCDILGLSIFKRMKESGSYIERVVGIPGVALEWIKLKANDGSLVELIQYHSSSVISQEIENSPSDRLGCSHIAFTVNDIDRLYSALIGNGYHCNSVPQPSPDGTVKVMYAHDPDGIIVELVQELVP
ncbi:glyoxalase [Candidatus Kuenenia stuttgartiensis]|uniref:Glyoxalase n=1 Tax=Kuenenia stuttgartiensis TaxID=174633 RepID=A0A6G7GX80_KUEST|nr:VOC family protein [Candidatus Kuenenia stuttgartiensis]MCZ7611845.1 VOC family protein [Ignavibacterium sp.]QII14125.1 glyoxalase [Candidatus Kuenenia stuttgartiensis]